MTRTWCKRAVLPAAVALAAAALFIPSTAQLASAQPAPAAVEQGVVSPISHLALHPGADETQLNLNWFTTTDSAEQAQIAPASAQTGEEFPVEAAAPFAVVSTPDNDRGLTTAKATVTGLEANTDYVYRVGSDDGGWSATYTYSTEEFGEQFNFNFYGDAQLGSGSSTEIGVGGALEQDAQGWYETLDTSVEMYPNASFLFHAGDQIDGYGDDGDLEAILGDRDPQYDAFFADGADAIRDVPLATLSGNHDHEGWTYDEYFNMPNSDGRSYWYTQNNALVIGLDINTISIYDYFAIYQLETEAERQEYFEGLRPQIEAGIERATDYTESVIAEHGDDADWIIVGFHQSPFSQANHYYDPDIMIMREGFTQSLSDAGVDLVLGGHDHIYTRTHLMEGSTPVVPEEDPGIGDVLVQEDGQTLYLTGNSSSGSKFYDFMDQDMNDDPATADTNQTHASTAMWDQQYEASFSNIEIDGDTLTVKTHHTAGGVLIDEVTLVQVEETTTPGETEGETETPAPTPDESEDNADEDKADEDNGTTKPAPEPETGTEAETDGAAAPAAGQGGSNAGTGGNAGANTEAGSGNLAQTGANDLLVALAVALALATAGGATLVWKRRQA